MKKIIFIIIIILLILTGCNKSNNKETVEEKINWYIEFDKDNDYIMCDNPKKNIDGGICRIGTYSILNGDLESDVIVALSLNHYYKNGVFSIVDIVGPTIINLERMQKYKGNIVCLEIDANEIYLIKLVEEVDYYLE